MIHFPDLRARRFTLKLRELTIGESLELASRPTHLEQANTTAFLRYVSDESDVEGPEHWRVSERILAVAHYLACVIGEPDYAIGNGHYSDFLVPEEAEVPEGWSLGEVAGEDWSLRHLTGRMVESIERLELKHIRGRGLWMVGMMACQMYRDGEIAPDEMSEGELDEWLQKRVESFLTLPESEFESLSWAYRSGTVHLTHLFLVDADDEGIICLPREDAGLMPARFSVHSCISAWARDMAQTA